MIRSLSRIVFFSCCFFLCIAGLYAKGGKQQAPADKTVVEAGAESAKQAHLGLGFEGNMNLKETFIFGQSVNFDYAFFSHFAAGASLTISYDFATFYSFEPALLGRWYFLKLGVPGGGLFLQEDMGVRIAMNGLDPEFSFLGGLSLGFRWAFAHTDYYIEPYVRGGYPFRVGVGLRGGCRL
ncbi:hypothetical protein AGMMS4952_04010 [Spirochaetia bacterium]|nr:hypothetical protein AGMMS4952_04010 [Spirochaetia bacterium]